MKIKFLMVLYIRSSLTVEDFSSIKVIDMQFPRNNLMVIKASAKREYEEEAGWMLEKDGSFREFKPGARRREWATPLSFLVQFVQSEFSISNPTSITVGELQKRLKFIRDEFAEAPIAADFRRHLRKYADDEIVSEQHLNEWSI
jgi:8-oxo-dGTP pyrophosphatase MutT (NUDIX family)